jgi:YD repeat-containing protein
VITFDNDRHDKRIRTTFPMPGGNDLVQRAKYDDGGLVKCVYSYRVDNTPTGVSGADPDCPDPTAAGLVTFYKYDYTRTKDFDGITVSIKTNTRYGVTEKGGMKTDYDYDPIDRLKSATTKMGGSTLRDFTYDYDRHSNLAKDTTSGTTPGLNSNTSTGYRTRDLYFGYDTNEELCWVHTSNGSGCSAPYGATTFEYDGAGALTAASTGLELAYNSIGQTAMMDSGTSGDIDMAYTGVTQDRRVTRGDVDMGYGFSGLDRQTRPDGVAGTQTDWFVRDPGGRLLGMVEDEGAGPVRYYLTDGQDSVMATMATDGDTRRYLYEPYGEQVRSWIDTAPGANTISGSTPPDGSQGALTSADLGDDFNP